jgi:Ca2+-binding RTX toxin-like protein
MPAPVQFASQFNLNVGNGFTVTGNQNFSKVTALANGFFFAAWNSVSQYEGAFYNSNGSGSSQLDYTFANSPGSLTGYIDVAALGDGIVGVAWIAGSGATSQVNFQRVGFYVPSSSPTVIDLPGAQNDVSITASSFGNAVLVFRSESGGPTGDDVYTASMNTNGILSGSVTNIIPSPPIGTQEEVNITTLPGGLMVSVWIDRNDGTIKGRYLIGNGTPFGSSEILVGASEPAITDNNQQDDLCVSALSDGAFVIAYRNASGADRFAIFSETGNFSARVPPTNIGSANGFSPQVLGLQDGRFVAVYNGGSAALEGQIYSAMGVPDGAAFAIVPTSAGVLANQASLALLPDGRFIVSYTTSNVVGGNVSDIVAQIWDPREVGVTINGTAGDDQYYGSAYNDTFIGGDGADRLEGRGGDDLLVGGNGADLLFGGDGNDVIRGGFGGDGFNGLGDVIDGGNGTDTLSFEDQSTGVYFLAGDTANATGAARGDVLTSIENITGGSGNDAIGIGSGDNVVSGLGGNDQLFGQDGNDVLIGGLGGDVLNGGNNFDIASYENATTAIYVVFSDLGGSSGEAAGDSFVSIEGLRGGIYNDVLSMDGNANQIFGGGGDDKMYGQGGNDILDGGIGADVFDGGLGIDTASYQSAYTGDIYLLAGDFGNAYGDGRGDSYVSIENIIGSSFRDIIGIGEGDNKVEGRGGNDWLWGQGGNDILVGGVGGDLLDGGTGTDTASYEAAAGSVYVYFGDLGSATGEAAGDSFLSIENITGSAFDDIIGWDSGNNVIDGGAGNDRLFGGAGNDTLIGGAGNDRYAYTGAGFGNDIITNFEDGADRIDFTSYAGASYGSLLITAAVGGVSVVFGADSIFIGGVNIGQITNADFLF